MSSPIRITIATVLLAMVSFYVFQLTFESSRRQEIVLENAEVKNIKYGLLSVHSWKRQISEIITKKVRDFDLTTENRRELRSSIQSALYQLLNEVNKILEDKKNEGGVIRKWFTRLFQSLVFDVEDLKEQVPEFTEIILDELDNYETREKLRLFVQQKVDQLFYETVGEEDLYQIELIAERYGCAGIQDCSQLLQAKLDLLDQELSQKSLIIIGLALGIFLIILAGTDAKSIIEYYILIILCAVLLFGGVNTPMIDIDARIETFSFLLMGETLQFRDQILFFQSKSIFEVVQILVSTQEYQSIFVGGLIFLFSIIFPISKLVSSVLLVQNRGLYKNKMVYFLALKSGKWSMADVVVVAIFMSYIGFKGVLENQLRQLEGLGDKIEILTTDNSNFGVGFMLFLSFCISSMILATRIDKRNTMN